MQGLGNIVHMYVYSVYITRSCGVSTFKSSQATENFGHTKITAYNNSTTVLRRVFDSFDCH